MTSSPYTSFFNIALGRPIKLSLRRYDSPSGRPLLGGNQLDNRDERRCTHLVKSNEAVRCDELPRQALVRTTLTQLANAGSFACGHESGSSMSGGSRLSSACLVRHFMPRSVLCLAYNVIGHQHSCDNDWSPMQRGEVGAFERPAPNHTVSPDAVSSGKLPPDLSQTLGQVLYTVRSAHIAYANLCNLAISSPS